MIWDALRGHRDQVEMFRRSAARRRLAQASLFVGPGGVGKQRFARLLAQCLLCPRTTDADLDACGECPCCRQMQAGTHPDFLTVARPEGKRELPIDLIVGPRERRGREGLCHDLALRPMQGERRIALIDDANLMNEESSNALLKTLEEPPPYSMLMLVAENLDGLLPTIRSRCQLVRFAPLPPGDLAGLLIELGWVPDRAEADALAALSEGSLETARQLLDGGLRALRDLLYERLAETDFNGLALAREVLARLEELEGDSQRQRENAGWLVRFCQEFYRRVLRELSGGGAASAPEPVRRFVARPPADAPRKLELALELFDRAALAQNHLDQMIAPPLCLQGLFDDLARRTRQAAVSQATP